MDRRLSGPSIALLVLLAAAVALSFSAAATDHLPGDRSLSSFIQDRPLPGRGLSRAVRAITGTQVVVATGLALAAAAWLAGWRKEAIVFLAGLLLLPFLQAALKELIDRPRPDPSLVDRRAAFGSPSFPSGHVMSGAYLYGAILVAALHRLRRRDRLALAWAAVAAVASIVLILDGLANVYMGVHWPSDVLGGYLWAAVILAVAGAGLCWWRSASRDGASPQAGASPPL
ncbi:MAG: phosphatase PAP2 family protein [Tepidiformaceae bacterium]